MFDLVEEAFDQVALSVEGRIDVALHLSVFLGRDVRPTAFGDDDLDQALPIIAAVADEIAASGERVEKRRGDGLVEAWPGLSRRRTGSPRSSTTAWILVLSPPRERPMA